MQKRTLLISVFLGGIFSGIAITTIHAAIRGSAIFTDVPSSHYADEAIGEMYELGVIKGYDATHFGPDDPVTRGQVAVLLKRLRDEIKGIRSSAASRSSSSSSSESSEASASSSSTSSSSSYNPGGYVRFSSAAYNVEKNVATGEVTIDIVRTGGNQGSGTIEYVFGSGGTAVAPTDYDPVSGVLSFASKETSKKVKIKVKNSSSTGHKTVTLTLKNPTGSIGLGSPSSATLNILDPSVPSSSEGTYSSSSLAAGGDIGFSAIAYGVLEGGMLTVTVTRTGTTSAAVGVSYATSNGSADGSDYSLANGTLSFAAGETSKTFTVGTTNNGDVDGNRVFNLTLSSPTNGAVLATSSATVTINDDEISTTGSGSIKFSASSFTVTETQGWATIIINRVGALTAASATYGTSNGSAIQPLDYQPVSGTMSFAAGETSKKFLVPIAKDDITDGDETVNLSLANPVGAALMDPFTAVLRIYE